jgi:two-component system cell cycle response regulator
VGQEGREETQEVDVAGSLPARTDEAFALYVVQGSLAGAVVPVERESLSIGRGPYAQLRLSDEGVSRMHARLDHATGSVTLVDLGSRNGTFVNGERIEEPRGLLDTDQIAVGTAVLRFAVQTAAEIRLAHQVYEASVRDHLTALYNRRFAEEQLHHAVRSVSSGFRSACMLHVDGLADINESAGRGTGDDLLRAVATKLADVFGEEDTIARWDGAELFVLSREPEPEALGARLRALVSSVAIPGPRGPLSTTASGGTTPLFPGANPAHVLALVEEALAEARKAGGNRARVKADPGSQTFTSPSAYSLQSHTEEIVRPR